MESPAVPPNGGVARLHPRRDPVLSGPSEVRPRGTKLKGVRVVYELAEGGAATRDHPTARRWEVTKRGELVLRDRDKRQVARYRQFVWREVSTGPIRDVTDAQADLGE